MLRRDSTVIDSSHKPLPIGMIQEAPILSMEIFSGRIFPAKPSFRSSTLLILIH